VKEISSKNFGLLIAYVLPGILCLWGVSYFSPTVRSWFGTAPTDSPTIAGFLYVTLAAIAAGMIASTVRWLVVDTIHHLTGIPRPDFDFSRFEDKFSAYDMLGEVHYRYYQFYGASLIALLFSYSCWRLSASLASTPLGLRDVGVLLLAGILFAGSRDTFRKYNQRLSMLLGQRLDGGRGIRRPQTRRSTRQNANKERGENSPESTCEEMWRKEEALLVSEIRHKLSHCHAKRRRQSLDVHERDVPLAALNAADIGAVKASESR